MELFLFRPADYDRLYNCSRINIESVPLERRQHLPQGIVLIALTAIYLLLYIPCIASIWKHRKDNACYAILFYISVTDILELFIIGFLHGWLSVRGDVFCSHPQLNYIAGVLCMECFWFAESMADMLLAFERCLEVLSPNLGDFLFKGKRVLFWLAIPTLYGCYNFMFSSPPGVYNGVYFCYFFNPFLGYIEDTMGIYTNEPHVIYDMVVSVSIPITYLVFFILLIIKSTFGGTSNFWTSIKNPMLNQAFLQVLAISMFNLITLSVYVYMKYTGMSSFLTYIVHFSWLHIHGFPPVIYLLLNKTIRKESKKFIKKYAVLLFGANFVNFLNTAVSDGAKQKPLTLQQSNKINCNTNISHINRSFLPVVAN